MAERRSETIDIPLVGQQTGLAIYYMLGNASVARGDDSSSRGHGFLNDARHSLAITVRRGAKRLEICGGTAHKVCHFVMRKGAGEVYAPAKTQAFGALSERRFEWTGTGDRPAQVVVGPGHFRESLQSGEGILFANQSADSKEVLLGCGTRPEAINIRTAWQDDCIRVLDPRLRQPVKQKARNGDDSGHVRQDTSKRFGIGLAADFTRSVSPAKVAECRKVHPPYRSCQLCRDIAELAKQMSGASPAKESEQFVVPLPDLPLPARADERNERSAPTRRNLVRLLENMNRPIRLRPDDGPERDNGSIAGEHVLYVAPDERLGVFSIVSCRDSKGQRIGVHRLTEN